MSSCVVEFRDYSYFLVAGDYFVKLEELHHVPRTSFANSLLFFNRNMFKFLLTN